MISFSYLKRSSNSTSSFLASADSKISTSYFKLAKIDDCFKSAIISSSRWVNEGSVGLFFNESLKKNMKKKLLK